MKTVSVIIPAYNHAEFMREAIDSALAQTVAPLEVVVVDDGSSDDTPQILASYGERIRALRQTNAGVAAARNAGIAAARGEYVAFLDADDVWHPRKLERQMARFESAPACGLVHCAAEQFDRDGTTAPARLEGMEGWVAAEILRFDREVIAAPGSTMVVPKRVAEDVGGFDHRLPPSEDWDFCCRVARVHPFGYVPEVLARYRQHGRGIHLNIAKMERAMLLALEKQFGSSDPSLLSLRRHSYGRFHRILAGCYLQDGALRECLAHTLKSLRYDIRNLGYFLKYPTRIAARRRRR